MAAGSGETAEEVAGCGGKGKTTEAGYPWKCEASSEPSKTRKHRARKRRETSTDPADTAVPCRREELGTGCDAAAAEAECEVATRGSEAAWCTAASAYSRWE